METEGLEWSQYIRLRGDWQDIVGTGVVACELCSVIAWHRRTCNRRTGILVTRSDGSSVCLHSPKARRTKRPRRMQGLLTPTKRPAVPARSG